MKFTDQLAAAERANDSLLCVGLDPEPAKFPGAWKGDAARIFDFCASIVDATKDLAIAFKPQIAYFAAHRAEDQLEQLIAHIHAVAPQVPVILDAKRGDIGSTAQQYAREAFERYRADAVTLSPFMGLDSIEPFVAYAKAHCVAGKGPIVLEMDTYRYHGHSMSDPGSTYRTRDEITGVRQERDPVERLRKLVVEMELLSAADLKALEKEQRAVVDRAVAAAKAAAEPAPDALFADVYVRSLGTSARGVYARAMHPLL
jgi:hypothetical protein